MSSTKRLVAAKETVITFQVLTNTLLRSEVSAIETGKISSQEQNPYLEKFVD